MPETTAVAEQSPFPPEVEVKTEDWTDDAPGSFLDPPEFLPQPDGPAPQAEPEFPTQEQPAPAADVGIPQPRTGNIEPPAQSTQAALPIGAGSAKGKRRSRGGGLPTLVKVAIPLVLLTAIAAGAIKFWPQIQTKLGMGAEPVADVDTTVLPSASSSTPAIGTEDDPSGFEMIDDPEDPSPMKTIEPHPQAHLGSHQPQKLHPVQPEIDLDPEIEEIPVAIPSAPVEEEDEFEMQTKARAVLDAVLAASSVDELAELVLEPERLKPILKAYYGGKSPALEAQSVIYDQATPIRDVDGFHNHTFFISTTMQPMRFPIGIEETDDGLKFDWESFIELHDDRLGKFLSSPQAAPGTFRVILARAHYFGTNVPQLGSKDCFRITSPIAGSEGFAFVDKDSDLADDCEKFQWDTIPYFPIVQLEWTTPKSGGEPYLKITKSVRDSWRSYDPNVAE